MVWTCCVDTLYFRFVLRTGALFDRLQGPAPFTILLLSYSYYPTPIIGLGKATFICVGHGKYNNSNY